MIVPEQGHNLGRRRLAETTCGCSVLGQFDASAIVLWEEGTSWRNRFLRSGCMQACRAFFKWLVPECAAHGWRCYPWAGSSGCYKMAAMGKQASKRQASNNPCPAWAPGLTCISDRLFPGNVNKTNLSFPVCFWSWCLITANRNSKTPPQFLKPLFSLYWQENKSSVKWKKLSIQEKEKLEFGFKFTCTWF